MSAKVGREEKREKTDTSIKITLKLLFFEFDLNVYQKKIKRV
jgi:hypothetical protein